MMKRRACGLLILCASLLTFLPTARAAAGSTPTLALADARALCETSNKQFTVGLSQGNPVAIAALYTSDALLQAPGGTESTKRDAIASFWKHMMDDGATGLALSIDALAVEGEVIIETGRFALISGQVGVVETGKYLIVRKREAGQWRIFRHIWNASQSTSGGN